jgi:hypothetical protein
MYVSSFLSLPPLIHITQMIPPDIEVLSTGMIALGGQWHTGLTRDVINLFARVPGSDKYEMACISRRTRG